MTEADRRDLEIEALRDRLSRLTEASLRINESLEFDTVLQEVLDSARSLTAARYGAITLLDDAGQVEDCLSAGMTTEEAMQLWDMPDGTRLFEYFTSIPEPLRLRDLLGHTRSLGLPDLRLPSSGPVVSFLAAPVLHRGERVGNLYVAEKDGGSEFTHEDEETLVMFASQAALVIANARRHRDERRARANLETLINTSPTGVVVFDARTGAPVSFNREVRRIVDGLGEPDQSVEQFVAALTVRRADGSEISFADFPVARALSTGETVRAEEIVLQASGGRSVTALVNATPIRSEDGEIESVVITFQDLTPLEEMERLRAEFLGMVSHELRAPLTSIKGSAATLLGASSDLDPAEMRQFFRIIDSQADNMRELIGGLLDVARIETGTLPISPEPAEMASLVDRARNTFLSGGGKNKLDIDIPLDLPLVMADRRRIAQVLGNLLSNAARHSPESSVIQVTAVRRYLHVAVSIADGGRGIPADDLPHLFRKFSRFGGDEQGRETRGSGLGLAICRGIVEAHGGRIWAESDGPGLGARFTFTIPAVEEAASEPVPPSAHSGKGQKEQSRILVVDDDPQTLRYVRDALSGAGYTPMVTADPEEAIVLMEENRPQLALLDLMLGDSNGIDLMKDILVIADVPVIFLSVYGKDQVVARAFEEGAADYIVKPFSPMELIARITAALRRRAGGYEAEPAEPYVLGELSIDYAERRVTVAGSPVQVTPIEYDLLYELSIHAGRVVSHDNLLRRVWGMRSSGDLRALRTHLVRLRRKLGEDAGNPTYIFAEPRVGYRMARGDPTEGAT